MKKVRVIEYPGLENLKSHLEEYKKYFIEENIIVLRNANLSIQDQEKVQQLFGSVLNCYPNKEGDKPDPYVEDHSATIKRKAADEKNILLHWHIEHPYYTNSMVAGFWNMEIFNVKGEGGKTVFVNSSELYKSLKIEDQEFLKKCVITFNKYHMSNYALEKLKSNVLEEINTPIISKHWLTSEPILKMSFISGEKSVKLYSFDGKTPTKEQKHKAQELIEYLIAQVSTNLDIRIEHTWQQGDLLIPDLNLLIHAVTGGFKPEERKFTGMWSYVENPWEIERIDIEQIKQYIIK